MPISVPTGGALKISALVTEYIVAHIELMCAPDGSQKEADALAKKDALLKQMTDADKSNVWLVGRAVARIRDATD